ncbi:MBOAT family protein [Stieleria sp. TO1_6]|uniref:MBOAT family O-acyltransferase n=1 Tax=Stieleria tagensis TaxID=2956795 RepID=UPI00209A82BE|nr:MBOAT family O-acyltransferase [Stieleria tagensis]MCO8120159.1 MBOAT family protein [Stieleria tagensis]
MIFSSPEFVYLFFPICFLLYLGISQIKAVWPALSFLVIASVIYYGVWEPGYIWILVTSIGVNYLLSALMRRSDRSAKTAMWLGMCFNLAALFYFKYFAFATEIAQMLGLRETSVAAMMLPLGISFFTFQQITFLIDRSNGVLEHPSLLDYSLFVSFFPQLIAGPIVHHSEIMPQFASVRVSWDATARGLYVFAIGLSKKVLIADEVAKLANLGYANTESLGFVDAWIVSLCYTLQLYFDFSGYSDMAVGIGLVFGVRLPWNFLSPYQATNISQFWRTWHVTLSRFLKDYVYIPIGGSHGSKARTAINLILTMLIGGVWHGAGWTFVLWGLIHGVALAGYHLLRSKLTRVPTIVGWAVTLLLVHFGWVFFRSTTIEQSLTMLGQMMSPSVSNWSYRQEAWVAFPYMLVGLFIALCCRNTAAIESRLKLSIWDGVYAACLLATSLVWILGQFAAPEFLYFDF